MKPKRQEKSEVEIVEIGAAHGGQRLDNFLFRRLAGIPRTRIYRIIRKGEVRVNGRRCKPEQKLAVGDAVRLPPLRFDAEPVRRRRPGKALCEQLRASVLYENTAFLVLDKPAGIAVHAGSGVDFGIIDAMRQLYPGEALELVHRLDRDTSGCLMLARHRAALLELQTHLRHGAIGKRYRTVVMGHWPDDLREIDAPLRRYHMPNGERRVCVDASGKPALSRFSVLARGSGFSQLGVEILTGRTHQIRVHCQFAGHPVGGDDKYGDTGFNRMLRQRGIRRLMLHAASLELPATDYTPELVVNAPLPKEFELLNQAALAN